MSEGQLVVILVIEHIEQVTIKWMNVFNLGEVFKNVSNLFVQCLLTELNLTHVKGSDSTDCIARMYDGWGFSLGL